MLFDPIPTDETLYCSLCGEEANSYAHGETLVTPVCPSCRHDLVIGEVPFVYRGLHIKKQQPKGTHWVICCFWTILFAFFIYKASLIVLELIDPPIVPPPIPLIGERFTEHEKDHLTLLSQVAAQDLLDQSLLPEDERDLEGEERIANAMRWAESHSNSPFANPVKQLHSKPPSTSGSFLRDLKKDPVPDDEYPIGL